MSQTIKLNGNDITLTDEQIEEIIKNNKPQDRWKPQHGEKYWYVYDGGFASSSNYTNSQVYNWRYSQGNCFKTEEEANDYIEYLNAVATLNNSSDFVPDWGDYNQVKYSISYDHESATLRVDYSCTESFGEIVFYGSKKEAEQSIEDHKKEWLIYFNYRSK